MQVRFPQTLTEIKHRLRNLGFRKGLFVGVSAVYAVISFVVAIVALVRWFDTRPIHLRKWPTQEIEAAGIRAKLKTDWNGAVRYQFVVTPKTSDLTKAFSDGVETQSISFSVVFYDGAGFELCRARVANFSRVVSQDGLVVGLDANGTVPTNECSRSSYKEAASWKLNYKFPLLNKRSLDENSAVAVESDATKKSAPAPKKSAPAPRLLDKSPAQSSPIENGNGTPNFKDVLTGFDQFDGRLETRSGHTFVIDREGERPTASSWRIYADVYQTTVPLLIDCKSTSDCLIQNTANNQAVHGKLLR